MCVTLFSSAKVRGIAMLSCKNAAFGLFAVWVGLAGSDVVSAGGPAILAGSNPSIISQQSFTNGVQTPADQTSFIQSLNDPSYIVLFGDGTFGWVPSGSNGGFLNTLPVYGTVHLLPNGALQLTSNVDSVPAGSAPPVSSIAVFLDGVMVQAGGRWYAVLDFSYFDYVIERDEDGDPIRTDIDFVTVTFVMPLTVR
jgi:hypothetical protein